MFDFLVKVIKSIFSSDENEVHYLSGAEALPRPFLKTKSKNFYLDLNVMASV